MARQFEGQGWHGGLFDCPPGEAWGLNMRRRGTSEETGLEVIFFNFAVECSFCDGEARRLSKAEARIRRKKGK